MLACLSAFVAFAGWVTPGGAAHPCSSQSVVQGTVEQVNRGGAFRVLGNSQSFIAADLVETPLPVVTAGDAVLLHLTPSAADRYGNKSAHIVRDGVWVQGRLLTRGQSIVYALGATRACRNAMLVREREARMAKRGVWQSEQRHIRATDLDKLSQQRGNFVLVSGKVRSVGDRSRQIYLNFGTKWTQDFTASALKQGGGKYVGDIERLSGLKNKTVQIRGYLEERQGPLIRLFDEAQIEIIK